MDLAAIAIVKSYIENHFHPNVVFEVFITWKCKALENWKYLLSSSLCDGIYYELTYNAVKNEWYLDVYMKIENVIYPGPERDHNE